MIPPAGGQETCAFHPNRPTSLHCTRCGRPACPECLTPASVGFQCRACVAEGRSAQRAPRTVTGARLGQQPIVTYALIAINVVIFLVSALQAKSGVDMGPSRIFQQGVLSPTLVASGQWWRLLTSGFLHLSVIHIGLNMLSLYFLGVPSERMLGRLRFSVVYLMALLGGSVAVMLFTAETSSEAGASGAIFGLMGALVVAFKRFKYDMRQLLIVLAINLYLSFQISGISWQAHIGGLVVGAAVTAAMVYPPRTLRTRVQIGAVVVAVAVLAALLIYRDSQIALRCTDLNATQFLNCNQAD
jgi:membrane associated rhomboid family serine protease